jgi:hypothetical protein
MYFRNTDEGAGSMFKASTAIAKTHDNASLGLEQVWHFSTCMDTRPQWRRWNATASGNNQIERFNQNLSQLL